MLCEQGRAGVVSGGEFDDARGWPSLCWASLRAGVGGKWSAQVDVEDAGWRTVTDEQMRDTDVPRGKCRR